ncbi:hypothetical protein D5086_007167 [Populus alba]|uniref:Uncharacterized protein n=1 Tax=Populus alba TaxID=43335 RepID=A0ACC4CML2_POPAL
MRGRGIIGVKTDERSKKTSGNDGSRDSKAKDKERDREKARDRKLRGKEKERQREKEMERERAKKKDNKSRQIEENKNAAKERASHLSEIFEEQVLHGLDKVMGGGAVVLTLKDQNILSDGDLNEDEASTSLRLQQTPQTKEDEEESLVFADDDEDLYKALERTRKQALKKQEAEASGSQAIALLATSTLCSQIADDQNPEIGVTRKKIVFTEMEEFLSAIHLAEVLVLFQKFNRLIMKMFSWTKMNRQELLMKNKRTRLVDGWKFKTVVKMKTLLMRIRSRQFLMKPYMRNMDKKKSKLAGIIGNDAGNDNDKKFKDIRIERTDKFGLTCLWMLIIEQWHCFEECFIAATVQLVDYSEGSLGMISHKFHGKGPGKMKQYQEELKLKQMKNSDTPSLSVERMREAQAQQTSDPRSGFATVDKDLPGGLTPMLGDKKVSQILTTVYTGMVIMMQKGCFVHVSLGCGCIMQVVKTDMISRTIRGGFLI